MQINVLGRLAITAPGTGGKVPKKAAGLPNLEVHRGDCVEILEVARRDLCLAVTFVVIALAGCAQGTRSQTGGPHSPSSPESIVIRPEHGGGNLPGASDM
jgi:hypothetical protein